MMIMCNINCNCFELLVINLTKNISNYFGTLCCMQLHFFIFFRNEFARLLQYSIMYGNFSKVVHWSSFYNINAERFTKIIILFMLFYLFYKNTDSFTCSSNMVAGTVVAAFDHARNACNNRILYMNNFVCFFLNFKLKVMTVSFKIFKIFLMRSNIAHFYKIANIAVIVSNIADCGHCCNITVCYFKFFFVTIKPIINPVQNNLIVLTIFCL